ncbi:hypothetical protein P171DRAFT_74145 [Karstenula rhodostoma CBS 690.94]|uniref:Uncharacterized protein n=1 Tax=Karstenula rhodostoma CBS 690.94 TaxID=1392251 RepID=A0A9P4PEI8_9PLEO|nr:hypothetical protein P171DRAFT_74145 [Karstenula rhodostoma CBS 690.94]
MRTNSIILPLASLLHPTTSLAASFAPVNLTAPLNWIADSYLFPGNVIAGYNANLTAYDATSWGAHVLAACAGFTACTSALAYQATNSGSTGGRFWFGYAFRGGPTDESFYERDDDPYGGVTESAAWTMVQ